MMVSSGVLLRNRAEQLVRMDNALVVLRHIVELCLPFGNLRAPCVVLCLLDIRHNLFEEGLRIGNNGIVNADVLIDLRVVNVNVDNLRRRCKTLGVGRNAVGEAGADADQQVAALNRPCGGNRTVHADHAEAERLGIRDAPMAIMVCADGISALRCSCSSMLPASEVSTPPP